jgi:phosphoribosylaminoimidazolecarboxamide formyltransferase / IMP cyclohydrolase
MTDLVPLRRALLSVSDKTGLVDLARALAARGVELVSTGGTARALREAGLAVTDVSELTGMPEMLGGRVKTLHPACMGRCSGGATTRSTRGDGGARDRADRPAGVNLYPFEATVAGGAASPNASSRSTSAGRRCCGRRRRTTPMSPWSPMSRITRRSWLELEARDGATSLAFRRALALTAFGRTAAYDAAVSGWLAEAAGEAAPRRRVFAGTLAEPLRYGENPHHRRPSTGGSGAAPASRRRGSCRARRSATTTSTTWTRPTSSSRSFRPRGARLRHRQARQSLRRREGRDAGRGLPGGLRLRPDLGLRGHRGGQHAARRADGGGDRGDLHRGGHRAVGDARGGGVFAAKKNLRLLETGGLPDPAAPGLAFRQVAGGLLVQDRDSGALSSARMQVVTRRAPSAGERRDLLFAWIVAKHVKSNAIVYAKGEATVGIGAGPDEPGRLDADRGPQGGGHGRGARPGRAADAGIGRRVGRLLSLRGRARRRRRRPGRRR